MLQFPAIEKSIWREAYTPGIYPPLEESRVCDVAIIGAGITGLTTAYLLKQSGFEVVVLEKDTVGGGTTGRTTGKVTSQHGLTYVDLQKRLGPEATRVYAAANHTALEQIEQIITTEEINCDWKREDNYVFTADSNKIDQFQEEAQLTQELGLPASFETSIPLPLEIQAAVKFSNQAKIHAQKYVLSLAALVHTRGSAVHEQSEVTLIKDGEQAFIKTKNATVSARYIVVATNVPTFPLLARGMYCVYEYPTESYIIAGPTTKSLNGMYISPDTNHFSILPVTIDGIPMVLVGGKSHTAGLSGSKKSRYNQIAQYGRENLGVTGISHYWSDRDYVAYDKIPLIGKLYSHSENIYVATAYRKWGLTNSTAAAMLLRDLIIERPNPWAKTFNPHRGTLVRSIPHTIREHLPF